MGDEGSTVAVKSINIVNRRGLHARAAAKFVTTAEVFKSDIDVTRDDQTVSARSIMGLMMLGAGQGAVIVIAATGPDAVQAIEALSRLVTAGFDEVE